MKKLIYVLLITLVALFGLTFSYKNHHVVEVNYYFGIHFQGALPLLLFITFSLGLLLGYAVALLHLFGARTKSSVSKKPPTLPAVSHAHSLPDTHIPRRIPDALD